MTVQDGLCHTCSVTQLLIFSCSGSYTNKVIYYIYNYIQPVNTYWAQNYNPPLKLSNTLVKLTQYFTIKIKLPKIKCQKLIAKKVSKINQRSGSYTNKVIYNYMYIQYIQPVNTNWAQNYNPPLKLSNT